MARLNLAKTFENMEKELIKADALSIEIPTTFGVTTQLNTWAEQYLKNWFMAGDVGNGIMAWQNRDLEKMPRPILKRNNLDAEQIEQVDKCNREITEMLTYENGYKLQSIGVKIRNRANGAVSKDITQFILENRESKKILLGTIWELKLRVCAKIKEKELTDAFATIAIRVPVAVNGGSAGGQVVAVVRGINTIESMLENDLYSIVKNTIGDNIIKVMSSEKSYTAKTYDNGRMVIYESCQYVENNSTKEL